MIKNDPDFNHYFYGPRCSLFLFLRLFLPWSLPSKCFNGLSVYEVEEICIFHPKGHNLVILGNKDKKRAVIYTPFQPKKKKLQNNIITPWQIIVITLGLFQEKWVHQGAETLKEAI